MNNIYAQTAFAYVNQQFTDSAFRRYVVFYKRLNDNDASQSSQKYQGYVMEFKKIPVKDVGEKRESTYEFIVKK